METINKPLLPFQRCLKYHKTHLKEFDNIYLTRKFLLEVVVALVLPREPS